MLHDSHIPTVDPDVEHDAATATVSTSPGVWGEGAQNPFQDWQPDGSLDTTHAVDNDKDVIELELADDIESEQAGGRLGAAGTVVSLLLHAWVIFNLSGLFVEPDHSDPYDSVIETVIHEPEELVELEEQIDYELANPDERELEVREVINSTSVGMVQNDNPEPKEPPTPVLEQPPTELQQVAYDIPEGIEVDDRIVVKGTVGEAIVQLESALDLVTWEIANNLKERKVLVVWMLDASGSLVGQRKKVQKRLKRIYGELNALERTGQLPMRDQPLLSAVVSYGQKTTYLTKSPTDQFPEIEKAFAALTADETGRENVFTAFYQVMGMWGDYRNKQGRQIMLVAITDEAGDDHGAPLEAAIARCRRKGAKAYVIGPSAPFGARLGYVPYVAPENGKTYQLPVDLGPDAAIPSLVRLPFWFAGPQYNRPPLSSGFAPYALARLVTETGGIYFMSNMTTMAGLAPLGQYDAAAMRPFEPDYSYSSPADCLKSISNRPLRMAVYNASMASRQFQAKSTPRLDIRVTPGNFKQVASDAQKQVAESALMIDQILQAFPRGIEQAYSNELSPRWRVAFALAYGRLLAQKVRCMEYNYACAELKNDLTPQDVGSKSNHWIFRPDDKLNYAAPFKKTARQATEWLEKVVHEAPGTPFAVMAARELKDPLGLRVIQRYVPPVQRRAGRPRPATPNRPRVLFANKKKNTPPARPAPPPKPPKLPRL
jgi:Mg-chelatase subunit ChlD